MSDSDAHLQRMARDIQDIKSLLTKVLNAITDAESEVPEKMRRFIMYMHDVHDIGHLYEERGLPVPDYIMRELERCDDRYRHILEDMHEPGAAFDKVRREMTQRPGNRWDHSRLLPKESAR